MNLPYEVEEQRYYDKLLIEKEKGVLKPLDKFTRSELKVLIVEDLATVNQLAELFDVSKHKIQTMKREQSLLDRDLDKEDNQELIEKLLEMSFDQTLSEVKAQIFYATKDAKDDHALDLLQNLEKEMVSEITHKKVQFLAMLNKVMNGEVGR